MEGIIYCALNKVNNKRYIGQTIQRLCERKAAHYNKDGCIYFHRALLKYNKEDWEWSIIDTAKDKEELNKKEIYWISYYNTTNSKFGYNIQAGGQGAYQSKEQIRYAREKFIEKYSRENLKTRKRKNIRCKETGVVYKNAAEAAKQTGICHSHITEAANGKLESAGGHTWEWCIDFKFFPTAIYCQELDQYYLSFNEAKKFDHFSSAMLSNAFYKNENPFQYAGYTFYKLNDQNNSTTK